MAEQGHPEIGTLGTFDVYTTTLPTAMMPAKTGSSSLTCRDLAGDGTRRRNWSMRERPQGASASWGQLWLLLLLCSSPDAVNLHGGMHD